MIPSRSVAWTAISLVTAPIITTVTHASPIQWRRRRKRFSCLAEPARVG